MYLGLDCSTQSLSAIIIDAENGEIIHETSVNFEQDLSQYKTTHGFVRGTEPDEFFSDPLMWVDALDLLFRRMQEQNAPLHRVKVISGSGQQHATVYLKDCFHSSLATLTPNLSLREQLIGCFSRPVSPIWLDGSTRRECNEIIEAIGGNEVSISTTGSAVTPRFSAAQIRKYSRQYSERWDETTTIHLASSFLASILCGKSVAIDYGDGAGMNLMNLETLSWDPTMANATHEGTLDRLPPLAATTTIAGKISSYFSSKYGFSPNTQCCLWSGDNPCSLVGMGVVRPGTWIISLGTSFTLFSALKEPHTDPQGYGHVFGNPIGGYMALSCFKNGALACVALKEHLGISWEEFDQALHKLPSEDEIPALPFYETEITPPARAVDQSSTTPRTLVDGQFLNMKHHSEWLGELPETILVTGGVSRSNSVCQTIANIFQRPVQRISTSSSASLGAALIAAHTDGHDIDFLTELFCDPSSKFCEPNPTVCETYEKLTQKFLASLSDHLKE
ncbi:xylulokinase [Rubritalea squalenifaciens DSM 18772]|uniref:Xylulokinase n=1 Tax=Rubritalea squalenifaciens DSM 18772 TaxID=1123071 RepID=A0A1M6HF08_9BACT|nr:FGGY family carbohydrate kinase [Rubritalea squalenifaciens]SHJ20767.1 xylulokinase [Rubritalea squalenifaciens DSM 18772]